MWIDLEELTSPEAAPEPAPAVVYGSFEQVGDIVPFGSYEQDNDLTNGAEPIEWIVLDVQDGRSLLISRYALDCRPFNNVQNAGWDSCTLRTWLNGSFLEQAFEPKEQPAIQTTRLNAADAKNPNNPNAGNSTEDRIFLLSIEEANGYFASDQDRQCTPTDYAVSQGCVVNQGSCMWWLRSPGDFDNVTAFVLDSGAVNTFGNLDDFDGYTVRPALWVDLEKLPSPEPVPEPASTSAPEPAPEPTPAVVYGSFDHVGDIVTFGSYEQDNDFSNGTEPIEWIVLDVQGGKSLLISRYGLDRQPFHTEQKDTTWDKSTLRTWLNSSFMDAAFSTEEQAWIKTTHVSATNAKNPEFNTNPGNSTEDKIFLLSINEANQYFASDEERLCMPTEYAKAQGCYVNSAGNCWWWLRSPGGFSPSAASVTEEGIVSAYGVNVYISARADRPALWVDTAAANQAKEVQEALRELFGGDPSAIGATLTFGTYEQDNDLTNGAEPIEWIVLDVQEYRSLLISRYALDCQPFHSSRTNVAWDQSALHSWLNESFLEEAFDATEQFFILPTLVEDDALGEDLIFLLSIEEARAYFATNSDRRCLPTEYAKAQGCSVSGNAGAAWWWLRSAGYNSGRAASVDSTGSVDYGGPRGNYVDTGGAVRPVLWVDWCL